MCESRALAAAAATGDNRILVIRVLGDPLQDAFRSTLPHVAPLHIQERHFATLATGHVKCQYDHDVLVAMAIGKASMAAEVDPESLMPHYWLASLYQWSRDSSLKVQSAIWQAHRVQGEQSSAQAKVLIQSETLQNTDAIRSTLLAMHLDGHDSLVLLAERIHDLRANEAASSHVLGAYEQACRDIWSTLAIEHYQAVLRVCDALDHSNPEQLHMIQHTGVPAAVQQMKLLKDLDASALCLIEQRRKITLESAQARYAEWKKTIPLPLD